MHGAAAELRAAGVEIVPEPQGGGTRRRVISLAGSASTPATTEITYGALALIVGRVAGAGALALTDSHAVEEPAMA